MNLTFSLFLDGDSRFICVVVVGMLGKEEHLDIKSKGTLFHLGFSYLAH